MEINMEMEEFISVLFNAFVFYCVFKVGQLSILYKIGQAERERIKARTEIVTVPGAKPLITIEEINGIYYAYDGNDFLAQGRDPNELGLQIATRFPEKYRGARISLKA